VAGQGVAADEPPGEGTSSKRGTLSAPLHVPAHGPDKTGNEGSGHKGWSQQALRWVVPDQGGPGCTVDKSQGATGQGALAESGRGRGEAGCISPCCGPLRSCQCGAAAGEQWECSCSKGRHTRAPFTGGRVLPDRDDLRVPSRGGQPPGHRRRSCLGAGEGPG